MFRSMSISAEKFTESMCQNDYGRSRSPSPVERSETPSHVLSPRIRRRLENIGETPPPREPEPVQHEPVQKAVEVSKKKIMAPPMQYDLHKADAAFVYSHIKVLTENDVIATEYLEQIKPAMFANQRPIVFGYIPAPPVEHIIKQVIGAKGYFFKMTTVVCGVYFIWHDTTANTFLFWGPSTFKVVKAMNSIRWRIFKYCQMYNAEPIDDETDDETDDDMPGLVDCYEQLSCGNEPDHEHPEPC
jgi:hypothetical protein